MERPANAPRVTCAGCGSRSLQEPFGASDPLVRPRCLGHSRPFHDLPLTALHSPVVASQVAARRRRGRPLRRAGRRPLRSDEREVGARLAGRLQPRPRPHQNERSCDIDAHDHGQYAQLDVVDDGVQRTAPPPRAAAMYVCHAATATATQAASRHGHPEDAADARRERRTRRSAPPAGTRRDPAGAYSQARFSVGCVNRERLHLLRHPCRTHRRGTLEEREIGEGPVVAVAPVEERQVGGTPSAPVRSFEKSL